MPTETVWFKRLFKANCGDRARLVAYRFGEISGYRAVMIQVELAEGRMFQLDHCFRNPTDDEFVAGVIRLAHRVRDVREHLTVQ